LDDKPRVEQERSGTTLGTVDGRIEFGDMSFAYKDEPGEPAERVLESVSLEADAGCPAVELCRCQLSGKPLRRTGDI